MCPIANWLKAARRRITPPTMFVAKMVVRRGSFPWIRASCFRTNQTSMMLAIKRMKRQTVDPFWYHCKFFF